jgi:hypothetical protein
MYAPWDPLYKEMYSPRNSARSILGRFQWGEFFTGKGPIRGGMGGGRFKAGREIVSRETLAGKMGGWKYVRLTNKV